MTDELPGGRRGLALARDYLRNVVRPLLEERCPGVAYAAARVGAGSEVLGLDDAMSRDHDWGLRLQLFVAQARVGPVRAALEVHLPESFRGLPTRIHYSGSPGPALGIDVLTVSGFARERLGFDPRNEPTVGDWLSVTGQAALETVAGEVFDDGPGDLTRLRRALTWHPDDVWRYVVACDWQRLDQELPLLGRTGDRGDELGSRTIAARLADVAVHLAFLLSRTWAPYPKWRGTMLRALPVAPLILDPLEATLRASSWEERGDALRVVLERLARLQADAGLPSRPSPVVPFWDRPYLHIEPALVPALFDSVTDPAVRSLPAGVGSIEQRTDNVDVLVDARRRRAAVTG
ncbi:DUF4037 domain-containing protein [Myceligenerans pegani]|uniref:DUF4037 domain-containing protein n=1 Tax=Myceligenerans pegani TaxID=2776917 RepID=A0ABR9MV68_9MICO|nr:DUF4037 domain-containing protein [Myceligenerans sp. TRM 65318]MBE1875281.1 DUF4037 domain-containing protein [Myceligenerans sp. TRM 65318]MBE3017552.1 DUF4037 domain-containing protein [Myceligenerans sp. TRM 65318]